MNNRLSKRAWMAAGTAVAVTAMVAATATSALAVTTGSQVATATAAMRPYLVAPTSINQHVPLKGKFSTAKPWIIITCELPQCHVISDGAVAAAKAAKMPYKVTSYNTTDGATLTAAVKDALQYNPVAVSPIGYSQALWNNLQPLYKAAGVFITPMALGDSVPSSVVTQGAAGGPDYVKSGKVMADYVISTSKANAKALVMDVPAYAVLKAFGDGFKAEMARGCSACQVTPLDLTPAQLATNGIVPAIISALQKDPSISYLVNTDGAFIGGLEPALKAAGINNLNIVSGSPDINNATAVKNGTQLSIIASPESQYGWIAMDIVLRTMEHMAVPLADGGRPMQLETKQNIGTPSTAGMTAPNNYQAEYKKLWGVS